ncbi:MAG: ComEA family DNA-binding protein [Campylobacterales bacterium]
MLSFLVVALFAMVNINTASKDELKDLKGIGEVKAGKIVEYREENGDFKSIDDLTKVKGIGIGTLKNIKDEITVK